jgi:hypothetical protein
VFVIVAHFVWRLIWGTKKSGFGGTVTIAPGGLGRDEDGVMYTANGARSVQGQGMHPADFDDGAECQ